MIIFLKLSKKTEYYIYVAMQQIDIPHAQLDVFTINFLS